MPHTNKTDRTIIWVNMLVVLTCFLPCHKHLAAQSAPSSAILHKDTFFIQETHEPHFLSKNAGDNEVRSIAVDTDCNVYAATAGGVFRKAAETNSWEPLITDSNRGPAYSVCVTNDGAVLMGTWNGLYRYQDHVLEKVEEVSAPVSVVHSSANAVFALGPNGIWQQKGKSWQKQNYAVARSVRDATTGHNGDLWVATDVGLYWCSDGKTQLYQSTDHLISSYVNTISAAPGDELWAGGLGGISLRANKHLVQKITTANGLPSAQVNCIRQSPDGTMWVGTNVGLVRYYPDGTHSLRFSKRWLPHNKVNDIAFDKNGNAWVATAGGVSLLKRNKMTLADKQEYFYRQLMEKHIREPWICGNLRLEIPGDTSTWHPADDDNDGEYTGGYLAMESFRYAVTKNPDALIKARKAFHFLRFLQEVTGTEAFFARTIIPPHWTKMHDPNRSYTSRQIADALVADPRNKPVEVRWHLSADGKWLWKGDTSSDEMCGHMMAYFFFYEYAATQEDKLEIRAHVSRIMDGLMANDYCLVDVDGQPTRWGVWSPGLLNGDPDWAPERSLNSFELLAFLKFAAHITGNPKYEQEYKRLIANEGYLDNAAGLNKKNPAWQVYFDRTMEGYLFPILLKYERDPKLLAFYQQLAAEWMEQQPAGENLINNLSYTLATGKKTNVQQTIAFLQQAPLDLVDWHIDHTLREDISLVRAPILEEIQVTTLPPADMRATVRWDKNPWAAVSGNPLLVREPVFWLWPYWMARYAEIIE